MDHRLRYDVWKRDKGVCQNCKRKLSRDPYEEIVGELSNLKEIPMFKWSKKCWKCRKETPIVSYDFAVGFSFHLGDIEKLDKILMPSSSGVQEKIGNLVIEAYDKKDQANIIEEEAIRLLENNLIS